MSNKIPLVASAYGVAALVAYFIILGLLGVPVAAIALAAFAALGLWAWRRTQEANL